MSGKHESLLYKRMHIIACRHGIGNMVRACYDMLVDEFDGAPGIQAQLIDTRDRLLRVMYPPCPTAPGAEGSVDDGRQA